MNSLYYDDLSADDSSSSSSDLGEHHEDDDYGASDDGEEIDLWSRCIVHLDVDCFYCQCEEIDGPSDYKHRPLAIGQKHIIVTSNYIARKQGVKKLQLRSEAYRACPSLLILEGSDLARYRQHSTRIYQAFREALSRLCNQYGIDGENSCSGIAIRKGGMDELFADVTVLIDATMADDDDDENNESGFSLPPNAFVYGNDHNETGNYISITEDQTGAEASIVYNERDRPSSRENAHVDFGSSSDRRNCQDRLRVTASLGETIRQRVRQATGFTTTMGVSVSPMLAKLTSDLRKPDSLNLLYPWRSSSVILPMPLRKVPELGHRTLKALNPVLERYHVGKAPDFWTCRDLLQCSQYDVSRALQQVQAYDNTSNEISRVLLQKCRGVDSTRVQDDEGGIPKTVSVENSFMRDTMKTKQQVMKAAEELFERLPKLLDERRKNSKRPECAFPNTIRLTARIVDRNVERRRPFVTNSRQLSMDGRILMKLTDIEARSSFLRTTVSPLLRALVFNSSEINVTRLNLAATNFQDIGSIEERMPDTAAQLFTSAASHSIERLVGHPIEKRNQKRTRDVQQMSQEGSTRPSKEVECPDGIDPSVLSELPPKIAEEVCQTYRLAASAKRLPTKKTKTIDNFFAPKPRS